MLIFEYFSKGGGIAEYFAHISGTAGARALKLGQRVSHGTSKRTREREDQPGYAVPRTVRGTHPVLGGCRWCSAGLRVSQAV